MAFIGTERHMKPPLASATTTGWLWALLYRAALPPAPAKGCTATCVGEAKRVRSAVFATVA